MARNKKKVKAAQPLSDEDERSSNAGSAAEGTPAAAKPQGHEADMAEAAGAAAASHSDSEDDEAKAAKAKKQKRMEEIKARRNAKKKGGKGHEEAQETAQDGKVSGDGENGGDADSDGELEVTRQAAVAVLYCPICTFPAEMCEFSGMLEQCRPWLQEHAAELADAEERGRKRRILTHKERLEAMLQGRGIKKALERVVVMEVEKRTGKRMITSVFGMDLFGFNMKDLSKDWRKAFACGAGVRAAEEGKHQDCIDIQGSVEDRLAEMLVDKYNIPKDSIYIVRQKKKEKYFD